MYIESTSSNKHASYLQKYMVGVLDRHTEYTVFVCLFEL
jgi:hypothetical protein